MKGQSEIVGFVLLFLIGMVLFSAAFLWSKDIFQENVDNARLNAAELFMEKLDSAILNVVEYGGSQTIQYTIPYQISLQSNIIEMRGESMANLPAYWVNLKDLSSKSVIKERMEDGNLIIQLSYQDLNNAYDYKIELYTDSAILSNPDTVTIEKNSTTIIAGKPTVKIRITFK